MGFGESRRKTSVESNIEVCYALAVAMLGAGASADAAVLSAFRGFDPSVPKETQRRQVIAATREAAKVFLRSERSQGTTSNPATMGGLADQLGNLTASERAAFLLAYLWCYTLTEVAVLTDTTPADVRRTIASAARKLVDARRHGTGVGPIAGDASEVADALAAMQTVAAVRLIVEQATGLVMEADECGAQEARATLVAEAARTGRTLRALAADVVLNAGQRPADTRQPSQPTSTKD